MQHDLQLLEIDYTANFFTFKVRRNVAFITNFKIFFMVAQIYVYNSYYSVAKFENCSYY